MESTGVYWIAPHEVLERTGLEGVLVGTRQLARVPGRKKTDRVDCRWDSAIAQLRAAARLVPAGRTGVHATDPGAGQSHGLQYLLLVGLVAAGGRRGTGRTLRLAALCNVALLGGAALEATSHLHGAGPAGRLLFGAYLGAVMCEGRVQS